MRVAAVDLGTNTTRLLVADVEDGRVDEVVRRAAITRLGEGVDARRRLLPLPIARVRNVLDRLPARGRVARRRARRSRSRRAPSATPRTARRSSARSSGATASRRGCSRGDEEARLTLRGVAPDATLDRDARPRRRRRLDRADHRRGTRRFHVSLDVGSVRLTERFGEDRRRDRGATCAARPLPRACRASAATAIGVAGTVTSLAALDLGLAEYDRERVHGHVLDARGRRGAARAARRAAARRAARGARRSSRSARP